MLGFARSERHLCMHARRTGSTTSPYAPTTMYSPNPTHYHPTLHPLPHLQLILPPPQIPRLPHQLLILMLLHLELPLPPHRDKQILPLLPDPHAHAHPLQQRRPTDLRPPAAAAGAWGFVIWVLYRLRDRHVDFHRLRGEEVVQHTAGTWHAC
jgi:hypothetical protein